MILIAHISSLSSVNSVFLADICLSGKVKAPPGELRLMGTHQRTH